MQLGRFQSIVSFCDFCCNVLAMCDLVQGVETIHDLYFNTASSIWESFLKYE